MEEKNLEFMEGMLSIVPQSIFIGTMDAYLKHIFEQMSKTEQELYNDKKTKTNEFSHLCVTYQKRILYYQKQYYNKEAAGTHLE